jgi:nucleotide-binding universal stress UspA family protein
MGPVLVPIEGDRAQQQRALAEAIRLHRCEGAEVFLLSVQMQVNGHVASYFGADELDRLHRDAAQEELAPAQALLDAAGVPHRALVRIGRRAETIARTAQQVGCDRIVLGRADAAPGSRWFGSIAQQVSHLLEGARGCQVIGA